MTDQNRNLALRVVSAIILFPSLIAITWWGGLSFALVCAGAAVLAAYELTTMFSTIGKTEVFAIVLAGLIPLAPWWAARHGGVYPEWMVLAVAVASMVLLMGALFRQAPPEEAPGRISAAALAWLYCGFTIAVVVALRLRFGFAWAVLAFVATWLNDTLAYFGGRFFGRHKMLPSISPKKTWEGFVGGAIGSVLAALILKAIFPADWLRGLSIAACFVVGGGAALLGPTGDLVESMLKRAAGVKDSGALIPGHGGLLDRIDALLFVGPWIYLCALVLSP
ncbi:MAG TPA: phosphatidate cytidylyltransferase [Anaeromyxobacteraceae bacterium]|nr:phosphatidate cytidylyltransferase [Anaeromyxobacteraceae bacterium]